MPIVTLRPDSTVQNPELTVVDTSAHGAVSDDSDSTYLQGEASDAQSGRAVLGLGGHTIPAGSMVVAVRARARSQVFDAIDGDVRVRARLRNGATGATRIAFTETFGVSGDWRDITGAWRSEQPGGGTWTLDVLDVLEVTLAHLPAVVFGGDADHLRTAELYVDVEYNEPPEVDVTGPADPVTDTSRPTIGWDYTDAEGDPQEAFELRVYDTGDVDGSPPADPDDIDADPVYTSGTVNSGADSYTLTDDLANDTTYVVYVRARQEWGGAGEHWSDWDLHTFALDLSTPDAPNLTVVPVAAEGRTLIEVEDPASSDPAAQWIRVQYRDHDDDPWTDLRFAAELDAPGPTSVYDHEAPLHTARAYRARGYTDVGGNIVVSPSAIVDGVLGSDGAWLGDPLDADTVHLRVRTARGRETSWQGRDVVHRPAGMALAVVESEPPTRTDRFEVVTLDEADHDVLVLAASRSRTLLLRDRREAVYVRLVGDRSRTVVGPSPAGIDRFAFEAVTVARPKVG